MARPGRDLCAQQSGVVYFREDRKEKIQSVTWLVIRTSLSGTGGQDEKEKKWETSEERNVFIFSRRAHKTPTVRRDKKL